MLQKLYSFIFWTGYFAVLISAVFILPWELDKEQVGTAKFHLRLDHFLHILVYFLICMYFYVGQRKGLILFRDHALFKFIAFLAFLATATEVVQIWLPYRAFSPADWISNISGVIIGLVVMLLTRRRKVIRMRMW